MATEYKVRVYDRTGALTHELTDYYALGYSKRVNAPGMLSISLNGEHDLVTSIALDYQVEVWRRNVEDDIAWYCDFYGLFRDAQRAAGDSGAVTATLYCPGQMSLLGRTIVAYRTGTADRAAFEATAAETIAKTLVTYNATSAGTTADGRIRDVDLAGISVETDGESGETLDVVCSFQNLLSALQEVASIGGGDFDLVKTDAAAWEFRWYDGQLGTDRSASVVFSLGFGNMAHPVLRYNAIDERTVAIVGGQGEGTERAAAVRTGAHHDADYNSVEAFVDGRNYTTTAGLNAQGDRYLAGMQARVSLEFDVLQTTATTYGQEYTLGDLVSAVFAEYSATKKIVGVTVNVSLSGETVSIEVADV
jgi:hypothetical protein